MARCRAFLALRGLAETRLAEVDLVGREYFEERGTVEAVEGDELLQRVRRGEVVVLDVRPLGPQHEDALEAARVRTP